MISNVAVIGAGTMGNGIAHVFAQSGFKVSLVDLSRMQLDKALNTIKRNLDRQLNKAVITQGQKEIALKNISTFESMEKGVKESGLVIEAASENEALKMKIFKSLDSLTPADCILASNTSSISITKLASATHRPEKVIGMHFMNPVPVMKLVEIIRGYRTDTIVTETIVALTKQLGKVPCTVNDYPGFIANRILMPMINEAIYSLHEGVAGVEEIDNIMTLGMAHPMGPLRLADFIGLDVCHSILTVMQEGFGNPKYAPCPLLVNMVSAGILGVKSGEGFYNYSSGSKELKISDRFNK